LFNTYIFYDFDLDLITINGAERIMREMI
jgi:hypothetical protein